MLLFLFISFLSISLDWINALDQRFSKWGFSHPAFTEAERPQARLWDQVPTSRQVTLHTPRLWERPCSVQPRLGQPMTLNPRHCPPQEARSLPCYIPERPYGCCDFQVKCMAAWQCLQIWTLNSEELGDWGMLTHAPRLDCSRKGKQWKLHDNILEQSWLEGAQRPKLEPQAQTSLFTDILTDTWQAPNANAAWTPRSVDAELLFAPEQIQ